MKNKIAVFIIFLILAVLFVPNISHAVLYGPDGNLTIVINTFGQGPDTNFCYTHDFYYKPDKTSWYDGDSCTDVIGPLFTSQIKIPIHSLSSYYLKQYTRTGIKPKNITCTSDNPNEIFDYNNGYGYEVDIESTIVGENITCTFNQYDKRTPVLIVPGIAGTEIQKGSDLLWLDINRVVLDPTDSFMNPLIFSGNLTPSDPNVSIYNIISAKTVPGYTFDYTDGLINEFKNQGYVEGTDLFTFPNDWRYGISGKYVDGRTNSDLLKEKIQQILTQTGAAKVDVVAHSMGGLIVKKYVADNPALQKIGKAVFVGVPETGAPDAVKALVQGDNFGISFGPVGLNDAEMKKLAQNMPGVYDLLPSQAYYNSAGSFVRLLDNTADSSHGDFSINEQTVVNDLNYDQTKSFLISDNNLNSQALTFAEGLHTQAFDDFDMRTAGVDLYSIDGCKTGTMTKFEQATTKNIFGQTQTSYAPFKINVGDGTVPIESSTNLPIDQAKKYYALTGAHSKLLSQDGTRQEIVNLISGSNLAINQNSVTQDVNQCQLNGKAIEIFSPIDISVSDQSGNELKLVDGNVTNEIPNANFEVWGDHKFVYLPDDAGQTYTINLKGTDNGIYTINVEDISDNKIAKKEVFSQLPVTLELAGQINLSGATTTLSLNNSPTPILPSEVLDYSADKTPPEAVIQFDPVKNDIKFSGTDNLSTGPLVMVEDLGNSATLTDEAGNTAEIDLNEQNRKSQMTASIKSIKYNGAFVDIGRNTMKFVWKTDRKTGLGTLSQYVKSGNGYTITASFDGKNTIVTGKDSSGNISQTFSGLKILKVRTNKGNLSWSY